MAHGLKAGFWFVVAIGFLGLASAAIHERDRLEARRSKAGTSAGFEEGVLRTLQRIFLVQLGGFVLAAAAAFVEVFG